MIAMYLEDISNGRRFIETARKIFWQTSKPMLCLKSGRSPEGAQGRQQPYRIAGRVRFGLRRPLAQSGVQRVDTIAELFDYAALYTTQPLPKGNRIAIITNAGGPGIMATDAAVRHGLKLAEFERSDAGTSPRFASGRSLAPQPDRRHRRRPVRSLPGRRSAPCSRTQTWTWPWSFSLRSR